MNMSDAHLNWGQAVPNVAAKVAGRTANKSLTLTVYEAVRSEIISCKLKPGEKLRIAEIAERFDVSHGAVREGLSRLVAAGLLRAWDQRGFEVSTLSLDDLIDISQTRIEIETLAIRKAIALGDTKWESNILAAFHELSREPKCVADERDISPKWEVLHERFHWTLLSACGSRWLLEFRDRLSEQFQRYRALSVVYDVRPRPHEKEHKDIMKAVLARDVEGAIERLTKHYQKTTDVIRMSQSDR
jgi:GntR family transcriptional regulator, carbon starvation induced regulator